MAVLFKIFMTINSLLLTFLVFLVKEQVVINPAHEKLANIPHLFSYILYFIIILFFSWLSIAFAKFLSTDRIEQGSISGIEPANDTYLPSYLGYFFVALSVPNFEVFFVVFSIIAIFIFYSRVSYFNPVFFIFGYHFFFVEKTTGIKILVIVKRKLKIVTDISFHDIKRINDYTFIELEK